MIGAALGGTMALRAGETPRTTLNGIAYSMTPRSVPVAVYRRSSAGSTSRADSSLPALMTRGAARSLMSTSTGPPLPAATNNRLPNTRRRSGTPGVFDKVASNGMRAISVGFAGSARSMKSSAEG